MASPNIQIFFFDRCQLFTIGCEAVGCKLWFGDVRRSGTTMEPGLDAVHPTEEETLHAERVRRTLT